MHQQTGCEDLPHKTGLASLRAFWLRANSRSPVQEGYDSEWDHSSRRLATGPSSSSWRESASITSGLDLSYPLPRTCYHLYQPHFCSYETLDPTPQTRALNQEPGRVASERRTALYNNSSQRSCETLDPTTLDPGS